MVWSLTQSQASWNVKVSGPYKELLQTKLAGIPAEQVQILKDAAAKVLHSVC